MYIKVLMNIFTTYNPLIENIQYHNTSKNNLSNNVNDSAQKKKNII
jgi:pantothenate kinase